MAVPPTDTEPNTAVQPICSRAHWSPNDGSAGSASTARVRSRSTRSTSSWARSASTCALGADWLRRTLRMLSCGIAPSSRAPTASRISRWRASSVPLAKVTRYGRVRSSGRAGVSDGGAGSSDGAAVGSGEGSFEGSADGSSEGSADGSSEGSVVGSGADSAGDGSEGTLGSWAETVTGPNRYETKMTIWSSTIDVRPAPRRAPNGSMIPSISPLWTRARAQLRAMNARELSARRGHSAIREGTEPSTESPIRTVSACGACTHHGSGYGAGPPYRNPYRHGCGRPRRVATLPR